MVWCKHQTINLLVDENIFFFLISSIYILVNFDEFLVKISEMLSISTDTFLWFLFIGDSFKIGLACVRAVADTCIHISQALTLNVNFLYQDWGL